MANITILKEQLPWSGKEKRYTLEEIGVAMLLHIEKNRMNECLMNADDFLRRIGCQHPKDADYEWLDQIINSLCNRDYDDDYIVVSNNGNEVHTRAKRNIGVDVNYNFYKAHRLYITVDEKEINRIRELCKETKSDFFTAIGIYMAICECSEYYKGFSDKGDEIVGYIGFISKANIAFKVGKSETTVGRYLNMMEGAKLIGVYHSDIWMSTNSYAIPCDDFLIDLSEKRTCRKMKEFEEDEKEKTAGIKFSYHKKHYGGVC